MVSLTEPSSALSVTSSVIDVSCYGDTTGEIDILVIGGTPVYNYTWATNNGNLGTNTNNVEDLVGLVAGDYTCLVIDENGCQDWNIVSIVEPAASLSATSVATAVDCNGSATGDIDITVAGGTNPYTYSWVASNGGDLGINSSTSEDLIGLTAGDYTCTAVSYTHLTLPTKRIV